MKSVVFCDMDMKWLPPYISLMRALQDLGEKPVFIGIEWKNKDMNTSELGFDVHLVNLPYQPIAFRKHPLVRIWRDIHKSRCFEANREQIWKEINKIAEGDEDVLLWTLNTGAMKMLGNRVFLFKKKHIHICYELEEDLNCNEDFYDGKRFLQETTFVQCERNRADIMAGIYHLPRVPFVISNCPYGTFNERNMIIEDVEVGKMINRWDNKFIFLYQGILESDRDGIVDVLSWICESFPDDIIAIQTHSCSLNIDKLKSYSNFQIIPPLKAPAHLQVTSHASVGIAFYISTNINCSPLNAIFCAPNKIYEYASFGIPTLGNDIPGLRNTIGLYNAGVCFEEFSKEAVTKAVKSIKDNYTIYSNNAKEMFKKSNIVDAVDKVIRYVRP